MAFTSIAALAAGEAASATLVLGAIAEVGTAMSIVGAVTGSKDLAKIGGVMAIAGGVGSWASGAAAAGGSAASAAGTVGGAEAGASPEMMAAADASMGGPAATADMAGGAVDAGGATAATDAAGAVADVPTPGGLINDAANAGGTAPDAAAAAAPDATVVQTPAGTPPIAPPDGAASAAVTNPTDARLAAGTQATPGAPMSAQTYWSQMMAFAQDPKNRTVLAAGAKLVGGALQGMQQQSMWDQKMGLDRDRLKQTSYGSQVGQNRPRGIIGGARA